MAVAAVRTEPQDISGDYIGKGAIYRRSQPDDLR